MGKNMGFNWNAEIIIFIYSNNGPTVESFGKYMAGQGSGVRGQWSGEVQRRSVRPIWITVFFAYLNICA